MIGNRGRLAVVAALAWLAPGIAQGQLVGPVPGTPGAVAPQASAYMNPYLNPYLNPLATQRSMSPSDAMLYLYSAQAATGGIGAGRLSGARATPTPAQARSVTKPASTSVPGAGAAGYFNPGPVNVKGAGRYYNRRNLQGRPDGR